MYTICVRDTLCALFLQTRIAKYTAGTSDARVELIASAPRVPAVHFFENSCVVFQDFFTNSAIHSHSNASTAYGYSAQFLAEQYAFSTTYHSFIDWCTFFE